MGEGKENRIAPEGYIWQCQACGKLAKDRFAQEGFRDSGWDASCAMHARLIPDPRTGPAEGAS